MIRKILDIAFWIAISIYFGGMVMLAVAAPVVFQSGNDDPITMTTVTSPALNTHLQARGEIFGAVLVRFEAVELAMLIVLAVVIALWIIKVRLPVIGNWLLAIGWFILALLLLYNAIWLTPAVLRSRDEMRTTAATRTSDANWPEKEIFDSRHAQSTALAEFKLVILLGMVGIAAYRGSSARPRPKPEPAT